MIVRSVTLDMLDRDRRPYQMIYAIDKLIGGHYIHSITGNSSIGWSIYKNAGMEVSLWKWIHPKRPCIIEYCIDE